MEEFEELKEEILRRAKREGGCVNQYKAAYQATTYEKLFQVIKDNFVWACENNVLDAGLIEKYKEVFNDNSIYCNESSDTGFVFVTDGDSLEMHGDAIVVVKGNASIKAYDEVSVYAYGNSIVDAYDGSVIMAYNNSQVESYYQSRVVAFDNAEVKAFGKSIVCCHGKSVINSNDFTTVHAFGGHVNADSFSYVISHNSSVDCRIEGDAICRIAYVPENVNFKKL